jgi:hypothetical protein
VTRITAHETGKVLHILLLCFLLFKASSFVLLVEFTKWATWTKFQQYLAAASADTDAMAAQAARVRRRSFYFGRCGCGVLVLPDVSTE